MNENIDFLFDIIIEDSEEAHNRSTQASPDLNKKYKIALARKSAGSRALKRAMLAYDKLKNSVIERALGNHFLRQEQEAAKIVLHQYVSAENLPSRTPQALELLRDTPHLWLRMLNQPRSDASVRPQHGIPLTQYAYNELQRALDRIESARQEVNRPKSKPSVEIMYADHCRYVKSPISGNRYLIVGINPLNRTEMSWSHRDMRRHWSFKLRDFYTAPHRSHMHGDSVERAAIAKKFEHIFTIKAENVASITKQFE